MSSSNNGSIRVLFNPHDMHVMIFSFIFSGCGNEEDNSVLFEVRAGVCSQIHQ